MRETRRQGEDKDECLRAREWFGMTAEDGPVQRQLGARHLGHLELVGLGAREAVHGDGLGLSDAVAPRLRLQVVVRVEVAVEDDHLSSQRHTDGVAIVNMFAPFNFSNEHPLIMISPKTNVSYGTKLADEFFSVCVTLNACLLPYQLP